MAWSKLSPAARGYGTAWRKLAAQVLRRDGYVCQCSGCKAADRITPATEVDHIISKAKWHETHGNLVGVDEPSNLQAINHDCHKLKSLLEKGLRPRELFDETGWPRDESHPWNRAKRGSS